MILIYDISWNLANFSDFLLSSHAMQGNSQLLSIDSLLILININDYLHIFGELGLIHLTIIVFSTLILFFYVNSSQLNSYFTSFLFISIRINPYFDFILFLHFRGWFCFHIFFIIIITIEFLSIKNEDISSLHAVLERE